MTNVANLLSSLGIDHSCNPGAYGPFEMTRGYDAKVITSYNPASQERIADAFECTSQQYDDVVSRAELTFEQWRLVPAPVRGQFIRALGEKLRRHKEDLGTLISLEFGKIRTEGLGEVQEMIDACDYAVGLSRQLGGNLLPSELPHHRIEVNCNPLGVVGCITAPNFPMAVWAWNAVVAAICGNTMVWKPSPLTPLCAIAVQHICNEVAMECGALGVFNVVIGGSEIGARMAADPRLTLISFTGSCAVGSYVHQTVAARDGEVLLELGGNNPVVVMQDANLELALRAITFGVVGTTGQRCTSTRRLFMHWDIAKELTDRLVATFERVPIGDPLDPKKFMGPLVNAPAVRTRNAAVEKALEEGGTLLTGGKHWPEYSNFVSPTIIHAHSSMSIIREETFAPILYIFRFHHLLEEAIRSCNDVPQALSSSIFTRDIASWETFRGPAGSRCGIVNLNNGTSGAEIGAPFGGNYATGWGREMGGGSWKKYMRWSSNRINHSDDLPLAQGVQFDLF